MPVQNTGKKKFKIDKKDYSKYKCHVCYQLGYTYAQNINLKVFVEVLQTQQMKWMPLWLMK